jgi:hypothetical protein
MSLIDQFWIAAIAAALIVEGRRTHNLSLLFLLRLQEQFEPAWARLGRPILDNHGGPSDEWLFFYVISGRYRQLRDGQLDYFGRGIRNGYLLGALGIYCIIGLLHLK